MTAALVPLEPRERADPIFPTPGSERSESSATGGSWMLGPACSKQGGSPLVSPGKDRVGAVFKLLTSPLAAPVPRGGLLSCFLDSCISIVCEPLRRFYPHFRLQMCGLLLTPALQSQLQVGSGDSVPFRRCWLRVSPEPTGGRLTPTRPPFSQTPAASPWLALLTSRLCTGAPMLKPLLRLNAC